MPRLFYCLLSFLTACAGFGQSPPAALSSDASFRQLRDNFTEGYADLAIPGLQLGYRGLFDNIADSAGLVRQRAFFADMEPRYFAIDPLQLSDSLLLDYHLLGYELRLNAQRMALESRFVAERPKITDAGIFHQPNGREWYRYLVRRWTSVDISPEELFAFGEEEVRKIQAEIAAIRRQLKLDSTAFYREINDKRFFLTDQAEIERRFRESRAIVNKHLHKFFPKADIPEVRIARGTNEALAQAPGYYSQQDTTFYYNLFDHPFNHRMVDFLYLHEGAPGHHYQGWYARWLARSDFRRLFWYSGYSEGWGAYIEHLGDRVGLYRTPYDWLGKWEWDLVRSVRVPLDVGINYYGWTDEEALAYWKKHVANQDEIAMREIHRMRRWPVQIHTYKVGGAILLDRLREAQAAAGDRFDWVAFHRRILDTGPIPMELLRKSPEALKDEAIIRRNIALFSQAVMTGDYDAIVDAYTADAKIFPGNLDIMRGHDAIRAYWTPPADRQSRTIYHRIWPEEIRIEGSMAEDWGYYEGKTLQGDGKEVPWRGKYVITWREVRPDVWKIYLDMWSRV